ncbi:tRNA dihydrouridine synthase [Rhodotorula toruloides]
MTTTAKGAAGKAQDPSELVYETVPLTAQLAEQPKGVAGKLEGHALWDSVGRPKYVVAPMVDQSELAWRILSRAHGANLCYTPMFHAALFSSTDRYQQEMFDLSPDSLEGVAPYDRPLVVQFCANDKDQFLAAARKVEGKCDAVDLNLGCPQGIAKRGRYGAFLMEEWNLIRDLISHLHQNLATPIIAKMRVYPTLAKTLHYASHVYSSGAQLLTIHGRTRDMKGQQTGLASWDKIREVVKLVSPKVPVLANGGCPSAEEVQPCLDQTGAYAVMSAEGNLYNPFGLFRDNAAEGGAYVEKLPEPMQSAFKACEDELDLTGAGWDRDNAAYAPATFVASEYLAIVRTLPSTKTATSAIKAHLYKLFRPVWATGRHLEMREKLGRAGGGAGVLEYAERVTQYQAWVDDFRELIKMDRASGLLPPDTNRPLTHPEVLTLFNGVVPYSHCQPYLRVTKPVEGKEEDELKKVDGEAKRKRDAEEGLVIASGATDGPLDDASKRLKPSPPSPAPASIDPTAPTTSAPPRPATTSCPGVPAHSSCSNVLSTKCSHGLCKACCALSRSSGEAGKGCEFHEEKERKEEAEKERRRELSRLKRERGEQRARENEERVKREAEEKRRKREEERARIPGEDEKEEKRA